MNDAADVAWPKRYEVASNEARISVAHADHVEATQHAAAHDRAERRVHAGCVPAARQNCNTLHGLKAYAELCGAEPESSRERLSGAP